MWTGAQYICVEWINLFPRDFQQCVKWIRVVLREEPNLLLQQFRWKVIGTISGSAQMQNWKIHTRKIQQIQATDCTKQGKGWGGEKRFWPKLYGWGMIVLSLTTNGNRKMRGIMGSVFDILGQDTSRELEMKNVTQDRGSPLEMDALWELSAWKC